MASAISRAAARLPLLRLSSQALLPTQIARFRSEFVQPNKPTAEVSQRSEEHSKQLTVQVERMKVA
uniref:Uncharacterized protein n=1 Tax=Oryza barthii TaxID=65489 RepID=A0A0D3GWL2_9ORYZ